MTVDFDALRRRLTGSGVPLGEVFSRYDWRLPEVLPSWWRPVEARPDGMRYDAPSRSLHAICSVQRVILETHCPRIWVHLSLSHPKRLPTWTELVDAKELFIGLERAAYQVVPPRSQYVNLHPYCLHLWSCLDEDPMPDFSMGSGSL